ncbi:MAG TPA: MFS transporter [Candidatus Limnocylindrales bacterium]|nr:MFS transporter [Candidatus Limnocylindrales bacterium]
MTETGRSSLWSNGAFVRFWSAATVSIFGSLITRMALPFVAILVLDAGPIEVAVLRGMDVAAALVFGLVAGAWVDRLRRRPVLIWADIGRAVLLVSIPAAFVAGWLSFAQLLFVAGLVAVLSTFFDAADNAYLPTIVDRDRIVGANGALAASGSAAELTGFGISGILVQVLTAPIAILVDSITFLVSAVLLATIRMPEPAPPPPRAREPMMAEIRDGLSRVTGDPILRPFVVAQMAQEAAWGFGGAAFLLFAVDELGLGPAAIGIIAGVGGGASFVGAVLSTRATRRFGVGPTAIGAMALAAVGAAFVPLAPAAAPIVAVAFLVAQQLVADSALTVFEVTETSVRQTLVADRELGRVTATVRFAAGSAQLFTTILGGLLAAAIGLRPVLLLVPLVMLVGAVALHRSPVRTLTELPKPITPPDPATVVVEVGRGEPIGG